MTKILVPMLALAALSAPALAEHRRDGARDARERIATIAHQVENATRKVHRSAERLAHHGAFREEKALERLHELERAARHFHEQVERGRFDIGHTENDLRVLLRSFYRAENSLHWLHAYDVVRRDFARVERLVDKLQRVYGLDSYAWQSRRFGQRDHYRSDRRRWRPSVSISWLRR
ncbi:MAG: hypothetical protein OEQ13_04865 [Acidobacteriota bacterium]|nr:hypothetical protein [Acidobacteriota bacterium]